MDISMLRMDGLKAAKEMTKHCPKTRIVMLTIYNSREYVEQALSAGAQGYILKTRQGASLWRPFVLFMPAGSTLARRSLLAVSRLVLDGMFFKSF
jgi:DNA-binding NarL/FixJ family response regulator